MLSLATTVDEIPSFLPHHPSKEPTVTREDYAGSILSQVSMQHQIPCVFFFAQIDFMDQRHPKRMLDMGGLLWAGSHLKIVPDCGHQMIVQ